MAPRHPRHWSACSPDSPTAHALLEESPFRLYYELYNAQAGDPLEVSIVVAPGSD